MSDYCARLLEIVEGKWVLDREISVESLRRSPAEKVLSATYQLVKRDNGSASRLQRISRHIVTLNWLSGDNTTWENLQIEKHKIQEGVRSAHRTDFVLSDLQIFSGGVIPRAQPRAQYLLSISNSFWYYLTICATLP